MKKIIYLLVSTLFISCNQKEKKETAAVKSETSTEIIVELRPRSEIKEIDYTTYYNEAKE